MLEAYILEIDRNLSTSEYEKLMALVSDEKRERIAKYHFFEDAQRSLLGDIMIRNLITQKLGLPNGQIIFSANEYGKPFFTNKPDFHFNISHAGRYVACAIGDTPLGVDVEVMNPIDMKIAERFFSQEETEYILSAPEASQTKAFYEIWTKKEAYVKFIGKGLGIPLGSFGVLAKEIDLHFHHVFSPSNAVCHLCTKKDVLTVTKWCTLNQFAQDVLIQKKERIRLS